jgi:hypothetical protein
MTGMGSARRGSGAFAFALCAAVVLGVAPACAVAANMNGTSVSADMQSLQGSCAVMNQFASPQVVVDPGTEFTGGQFTPNAGFQPPAVQQINSFGMEVDLFLSSIRIIMQEIPGSIQGYSNNFGPVLRVNVSDLTFVGEYLSGIAQTSGPPVSGALITSSTSVAFDFKDFSARTMEFQLLTTVPEPQTGALLLAVGMMLGCFRRWARVRT